SADPYGGIGRDLFMRMGLGIGAHQFVGSYDTVAEMLRELYEAGIESALISFFDPFLGLQQMEEEIFPRLKKMGLRH
ncbi:MAG: LLM class flavin-dependent oxidoreductase, partial [bacterium]|nr:LLM class flavin-dependent oxidoreductase [bacterium]